MLLESEPAAVQRQRPSLVDWYCGHGRLGPYSVAWFDFFGTDNKIMSLPMSPRMGKSLRQLVKRDRSMSGRVV